MAVEEKLEKLTERHEALTQTVELMAAESRDRDQKADARMTRLIETVDRVVGTVETPSLQTTNASPPISKIESAYARSR